MAALQLDDFLRNGNVKNSVNFANVSMARSGDARICVLSAATDTLVADVSAAVASAGVAIVGIASKGRGENAYTLIDVTGDASAAVTSVAALESVYRVYAI
jgi:D-3-phosphoglycerate dehydrogenase